MRLAPIDAAVSRLLDFSTSSDVATMQVGTMMNAAGTQYDTTSNVANWGVCEIMAVSSVAASVVLPGTLCHVDKNFRITATAAAASEINSGSSLVVALTNFAIGSTTEQFGWVLIAGVTPVRYSVAATTGRMFVGTAGLATPTAAAGGQILNAQCLIAAVSTFTRSGTTRVGSSIVKFPNTGGMYVGQAISGTGIPGSSVISSIPPDGTSVLIGSAVGTLVVATATGTVTCTMTNTGYGICHLNRPFVQGQIT
jgi:hypothetical protein